MLFAIIDKGTNNTRFYQCGKICLIWKMRVKKENEEISESQPAASLLNKDMTVLHEKKRPPN